MAHKLTTCTFCGVGCGLYLETSRNEVTGAYPSMSHPANAGRICLRGWHAHEIASSPRRVKNPRIRKDGRWQDVSWDEALGFIATRLREIRQTYGPDSIAFLNSPRCSNEEAYLLQKFARTIIGTNNVDHGAGVFCHNSVDVLLDMIGVAASTNSIAELAETGAILVDSVDLARRAPTIGGAVIRAKAKGAKLIVVGTRRHRVAENADIFLHTRPATEEFLYGAMAKVIFDRGLMNLPFIRNRCRGYEPLLDQIREYDLLQAAEICGAPATLIEEAALVYAGAPSAMAVYSTGMETRSPEGIRALLNLVLLTGNLGRRGAGIFALCGQNNLQGVCDMGALPDRLPGYRRVADAGARTTFEALWKTPLPTKRGLSTRSVFWDGDGDRGRDKVRALWLCRYDPVSAGHCGDAAAALRDFDFVVAQHPVMTRASEHAHVLLPTAAYSEERVSFTSTERRIQLAEQAIDPPAGPKPAWQQLTELARRMGADWNYRTSAEVMDEIGEAVPFYSGASHENLARDYGRQWPCTKDHPLGTPFLFADLADANGGVGKQPFHFAPVAKPAPTVNPREFPLTLVTGGSVHYWNQDPLVRHSETLNREYRILSLDYPEGFVEINPDDARQIGVRDGEKIRLQAEGATAVSTARVTAEVRSGAILAPYFVLEIEKKMRAAARSNLIPVRVEKEAA